MPATPIDAAAVEEGAPEFIPPWAELAKTRFMRRYRHLGHQAPHEVIEAGRCGIELWFHALEAAQEEWQRGSNPLVLEPSRRAEHSLRTRLLSMMASETGPHSSVALAQSLGALRGSVRDQLVRMQRAGLLRQEGQEFVLTELGLAEAQTRRWSFEQHRTKQRASEKRGAA